MEINYIYCTKTDDGKPYASLSVGIEVLNELKAIVEDRIVDYGRVRNLNGIMEEIGSWDKLTKAIEEMTPEPIPEAEEQTDE